MLLLFFSLIISAGSLRRSVRRCAPSCALRPKNSKRNALLRWRRAHYDTLHRLKHFHLLRPLLLLINSSVSHGYLCWRKYLLSSTEIFTILGASRYELLQRFAAGYELLPAWIDAALSWFFSLHLPYLLQGMLTCDAHPDRFELFVRSISKEFRVHAV